MNTFDSLAYEGVELHDLESDTTNFCYSLPCKPPRDSEYFYHPGSDEYKKERKRRQNRESAVKIRARKKLEESKIFLTLEILKESTGKLKIENAELKDENNALKKQISLLKKLSDQKMKTDGDQQMEMKDRGNAVKIKGNGKSITGVGMVITLLSVLAILRVDDSEEINTGERSLAFFDAKIAMRPLIVAALVVFSGIMASLFFARRENR